MVLVAIALLPLGAIGVWQADNILRKDASLSAAALIAITERAAAEDARIIERAIGAAEAMGKALHSLQDEPEACTTVLRHFESGSPSFEDAVFLSADGRVLCASDSDAGIPAPAETGLSGQQPALFIETGPTGSGAATLVVSTPVVSDGALVGHLRLSLPRGGFDPLADMADGERPQGLVTFNGAGQILTSARQLPDAASLLPADLRLASLVAAGDHTFEAVAGDGQKRLHAVVALVPEVAYALGTWDAESPLLQAGAAYWRTITLALLMWAMTLAVVYLIMRLEVINGVRVLHAEVRAFRERRRLPREEFIGRGELLALEADFRDLAETILREEAELENALHEKTVLLKEVHHRVKNNLQLVNSILNMLLRRAHSDETRQVLARLQDRILALAAVHRAIYKARSIDRVDAAEIVRDIATRATAEGAGGPAGTPISLDLTPVPLDPDQVLPLALLVCEATATALAVSARDARIEILLSHGTSGPDAARGEARLRISHDADRLPDGDSAGFSLQLMQALAHQLDSELVISREDRRARLEIVFDIGNSEAARDPSTLAA